MATEAQIRANRLNAQRSTGPKTPEGRARSAQNARKHGLAAGPSSPFGPEVERLARALAGECAPPDLMDRARQITQSSIQLALVHEARALLWQGEGAEPASHSTLNKLRGLERYESRALASRDQALREFTAIQRLHEERSGGYRGNRLSTATVTSPKGAGFPRAARGPSNAGVDRSEQPGVSARAKLLESDTGLPNEPNRTNLEEVLERSPLTGAIATHELMNEPEWNAALSPDRGVVSFVERFKRSLQRTDARRRRSIERLERFALEKG